MSKHLQNRAVDIYWHAMGRGGVSQHAMGQGVYPSMQWGRGGCVSQHAGGCLLSGGHVCPEDGCLPGGCT